MHLVVYGDYKKIINVTDSALFQEIEKKFEIALKGKRVQFYSTDYEEWCDISEKDDVPFKSKIRVIEKIQNEGAVDKATSSALNITSATAVHLPTLSSCKLIKSFSPKETLYADRVDNDDDGSSNGSSDTIPLMRHSNISSESTSSDQSGHNGSSSGAVWPLVYSLPSFAADVQKYLKSYEWGVFLVPKIRKSILEALYVDLSKYGMYPRSNRYHQVCYTLVSKYPQLRDRHIFPGKPNYIMWLEPLKSKFKEARRRMEKNGYMRVMQEKYGRSKRKCDEDEGGEVCKRRGKVVTEKNICLEDESTVAKHKAFIRNEAIKEKPDFASITDRMDRTFSARRKTVKQSKSVAEVLEEYPALKMAKMINHEMKRLGAVDVLTAVHKINRYSFIRLLQWKAVPYKINKLIDEGLCTTLAAIPSAFNEKWKTFLLIDEEAHSPYPVLIYKSDTKRFEVHLEGCIINGVQDFLEGVATLLSSYWVFDLDFPKGSVKTVGYIAGTLVGLSGVSMPNAVLTALNRN